MPAAAWYEYRLMNYGIRLRFIILVLESHGTIHDRFNKYDTEKSRPKMS